MHREHESMCSQKNNNNNNKSHELFFFFALTKSEKYIPFWHDHQRIVSLIKFTFLCVTHLYFRIYSFIRTVYINP